MQNQVLIPALVARLGVEVADKQRTLAEHEAKATDVTADATVRQPANDAIVAQTPYLSALGAVRPKLGECFQVLTLVEPLAKHTHNALDPALDYAVRSRTATQQLGSAKKSSVVLTPGLGEARERSDCRE